MANRVYILSDKGFYKSATLHKEENTRSIIIEWCTTINDAFVCTSKQAQNIISKHHLSAFIWNPWKERHTRKGMWRIQRRTSYTSYFNGNPELHEVLEWYPKKVIQEPETDLMHLIHIDKAPETFYDNLQDATIAANEKNNAMLKDLSEIIEKLQYTSNLDKAETRAIKFGL